MTENATNDLLLGHLKSNQGKHRDHDGRCTRIQRGLLAARNQRTALVQSAMHRDVDLASLNLHIERIERRLELADG